MTAEGRHSTADKRGQYTGPARPFASSFVPDDAVVIASGAARTLAGPRLERSIWARVALHLRVENLFNSCDQLADGDEAAM